MRKVQTQMRTGMFRKLSCSTVHGTGSDTSKPVTRGLLVHLAVLPLQAAAPTVAPTGAPTGAPLSLHAHKRCLLGSWFLSEHFGPRPSFLYSCAQPVPQGPQVHPALSS